MSATIAIRAARSPNHGRGSKNPNMASEGIVCRMFATAMTGLANRCERVRQIPAGTAIAVARSIAAPVSQRCSIVSVAIEPPYWLRNLPVNQPLLRCSERPRLCFAAVVSLHVGCNFRLSRLHELVRFQVCDHPAFINQQNAIRKVECFIQI